MAGRIHLQHPHHQSGGHLLGNHYGGNGCSATDTVVITPDPCVCQIGNRQCFFTQWRRCEWWIPPARLLRSCRLSQTIYNRWGQLLFETNDPFGAWDGTFWKYRLRHRHYVYTIDYTRQTGETGLSKGKCDFGAVRKNYSPGEYFCSQFVCKTTGNFRSFRKALFIF